MNESSHPTITALRGAVMVMETAEREGLPIPTYSTISSYSADKLGVPLPHGISLSWQPGSLADLAQWAQYLDVTIREVDADDKVLHCVDGVLHDLPIDLCVIVAKVEAVA